MTLTKITSCTFWSRSHTLFPVCWASCCLFPDLDKIKWMNILFCHGHRKWGKLLPLSLPKVINFKFPLQPHQKYNHQTVRQRTWLFIAYSNERWYTTNSYYSTPHIHSLQKVERLPNFELGNENCCLFYYQEWSISNFSCSLTRDIRSHSLENLVVHS